MAKGQDTPQGGDGFIKYLADDRTCLPAHRLLLEAFPELTASAAAAPSPAAPGDGPALLGGDSPVPVPVPIPLCPGDNPIPVPVPLAAALPRARRSRGWHRSLLWAPPGLGEPGAATATPVLVRVPSEQLWVAPGPFPAPWHSGCPSRGWQRRDAALPQENAFRCLFLRQGIANGNPDPSVSPAALPLRSAQGAIKKGVNYLPK